MSLHALVSPSGNSSSEPSHDEALPIFENAIASFRDTLSAEDRLGFKPFTNPKSMIRDVKGQCEKLKDHRRLHKTCEAIDRFAMAWSPFFDIINIFVSTHPEWAGFAWGAIRLVFLLSSNYTSFFEKLGEMFQRILLRLPNYASHLERLQRRGSLLSQARVLKALSYVYADIIQFCQGACRIFTNKRGGSRHSIAVIRDLFWKPFDSRFGALLDRLQDHQELFDIELRLEDQVALERFIRTVEDDIAKKERIREDKYDRIADRQREMLRTRVREIKEWIAPPDFMYEFENARRNRLPGTGQWLIENDQYCAWKYAAALQTGTEDDQYNWTLPYSGRILKLQAHPGFGKSVLSALLIEDLLSGPSFNVAFFHFDSELREKRTGLQALRAILIQFIHRNQASKHIIDTVSLLMDDGGSGQPRASDDELVEIFSLFLRHIPDMILLFDGIDECADITGFLETLQELCQFTTTKILLIGRPSIVFPHAYSCPSRSIIIDETAHRADIKTYLETKLERSEIKIAGGLGKRQIVNNIAHGSGSMFLWAKQMVSYLASPALSPLERLNEITNVNLVEGLDFVYGRTMKAIEKRIDKEKLLVHKTFQILAVSLRPLTVMELQTTLASHPGHPVNKLNLIDNLENRLSHMCGALVEIRPDKSIRFMHLSVKEYITSRIMCKNYFLVDTHLANIYLTKACLSYIVFDMPASPLSGAADCTAKRDELADWLPLLEYAVQSWNRHLSNGFDGIDHESRPAVLKECKDIVLLLSSFLDKKACITAWIEAAWTFGKKAEGITLADALEDLEQHLSSANEYVAQLAWYFERLGGLWKDLEILNKEWSHLLVLKPNEIWGDSVSAFFQSEFWLTTKKTIVLNLKPTNDSDTAATVIASQVSMDGGHLGVIEVIPSKKFIDRKNLSLRPSVPDFSGWIARYRIHELGGNNPFLYQFDVNIPQSEISRLQKHSRGGKMRFPIAFCANLQQVALLSTVVRIHRDAETSSTDAMNQDYSHSTQSIDLSPHNVPLVNSILDPSKMTEDGYPERYRMAFSPNGKYLVVVKLARCPGAESLTNGLWFLTIWEDVTSEANVPNFTPLAATTAHTTDLLPDGTIAFHPTKPLLVVSGDIETFILAFDPSNTWSRAKQTIYPYPLDNIHFSECGNIVYGALSGLSVPVIVEIEALSTLVSSKAAVTSTSQSADVVEITALSLASGYGNTNRQLTHVGPSQIQGTNQIVMTGSPGTEEMTIIRRYSHDGGIVKKTLGRNGEKAETLFYLPQSTNTDNSSVTLLNPAGDDDWISMVVNKNQQETYDFAKGEDLGIPAVVMRERSSITPYTTTFARRIPQKTPEVTNDLSMLLRPGHQRNIRFLLAADPIAIEEAEFLKGLEVD